jgi:hypothetical protein
MIASGCYGIFITFFVSHRHLLDAKRPGSISSDGTNNDGLRADGVGELVSSTTGSHIGDGAGGTSELVESTVEVSLEGVGLLVSDPALGVLVVVRPGLLEVRLKEGGNLRGAELVGSLEDGTSGELGVVLHEELLTGLVARRSHTLLAELSINVVHNLILIGTVIAGDSLFVPGLGIRRVSTLRVRVVLNLNGSGEAEESRGGNGEFHFVC